MRRLGLHVLFFLSGASALVYELVGQRLLNLVFGVSTLSVSTVLAAFMGGLALGGWLFGRLVDRSRRPVLLYAGLEAGIAIGGLLLPAAFAALVPLYVRLAVALQPGPWGGVGLRLAIGFPVVAGLATLIGGTLPVMGRLTLARTDNVPGAFSLLYAVNTLGAAFGAALTGFLLLRSFGMRQTLLLAAGANLTVSLSSMLLFSRGPAARECRTNAPASQARFLDGRASVALICAFLTGALSMGFEIAWARVLGILTSNSAHGFALLLTILLLGLVLGSLLLWVWSRWPGNVWRRLATCQWLLAFLTLASLPFFHSSPEWLDRLCDGHSTLAVFLGELGLTALALLMPAILMGLGLPLLVGGLRIEAGGFGRWLGRVYAVNTLGCVVGAFLTGFVLVPRLGLQATFSVLVAECLLVGVLAWFAAPRSPILHPLSSILHPRFSVPLGVVLIAFAGHYLLPASPFLKSPVREPRQLLYYREGNNGTVSVVEEANGTRSIMVDGQPVAGTSPTSVLDQKMLAHLPLLLHPNPKRALTVGFGSGGTSSSMMRHGIDVDCVEIEAAVPGAAVHFLTENHGVLDQRHFRLVLDDARSWLRVAPTRYDVIVTDCTNVQYRSNGDLYTVDYFRLLGNRLTPGGVAAAWVPANGIAPEDLKTLLRSFHAVFPHTSIWYVNVLPTDFLIVVGTPGPLEVDWVEMERRMRQPGVAEDLAAVGLADPSRLLYTLLTAEEEVGAFLGEGPLNTDDRPILSYSTYGSTYRSTIAANLVDLLTHRTDAARFVRQGPSSATLLRHYVASNEVLLGHLGHFLGDRERAWTHYARAVELLPEEEALRALLVGGYLGPR